MTTAFFHPATIQLLRLQSRARRRRIVRRFCQTRRLFLSAIACVLAAVWLGNAVITVWLREPASPDTLRALLSLGLLLYAGWHFAKAAFFRPDAPFEWSSAERELLSAMPLRPRDLVAYQLASVAITTFVKAGLFAMLLFPDLRCVALGFVGVLLVLMFLEMLRMAVQIATWSMSRPAFLAYRAAVVAGLIGAGCAVASAVMRGNAFGGRIQVGEGLLQRFLDILVHLDATVFRYANLPFRPFVELTVSDAVTPSSLALAAATATVVVGLAATVIGLYSASCRWMTMRERRDYCPDRLPRRGFARPLRLEAATTRDVDVVRAVWRIPRWAGAGPVAWRQLVGARRQWGSLLTAMLAPAVLSLAPCYVIADPYIALLATTGTLAFYTFLLLPTALRFDFRRDLDRLAMFKSLPIAPRGAIVGQILAPVAIATLFQCAVLALAVAARSLPPHHFVLTVLVMIPLNMLVFALENLVFLLYPYRVQQEGLEIFFRTMLTFTGKGLLFAVGLGLMSAWGFAAADLTRALSQWTGVRLDAFAVFTAGMIAGPTILAGIVVSGLCGLYRNLDPADHVAH